MTQIKKDWSAHVPAAELRKRIEGLTPEEALAVLLPHVRTLPTSPPPSGRHLRYRAGTSWGRWVKPKFSERDVLKKPPRKATAAQGRIDTILANIEREEEYRTTGTHKKRRGAKAHYTKREVTEMRQRIRKDAVGFVEDLIKTHGADMTVDEQELARRALTTAAEIMDMPGDDKTRMLAVNTILNFTKSKPVQKQEVTVNTAEQFLDEIAED